MIFVFNSFQYDEALIPPHRPSMMDTTMQIVQSSFSLELKPTNSSFFTVNCNLAKQQCPASPHLLPRYYLVAPHLNVIM